MLIYLPHPCLFFFTDKNGKVKEIEISNGDGKMKWNVFDEKK